MINFVRNVTNLAKNARLDLIIIVLSAQMDLYKMEHTYSRAQKNVQRLVLQEPIYAMMEFVSAALESKESTLTQRLNNVNTVKLV